VHEPEAEWLSSTGEPDALKGACPVRRGPDGKGAAMPPRRLATLLAKWPPSPTRSIFSLDTELD
jgi:hypothetical protein